MGSRSPGVNEKQYLYYYYDDMDERRGPFSEEQMLEWYQRNYFPDDLKIEVYKVIDKTTLSNLKARNGIRYPFAWQTRGASSLLKKSQSTQTNTTQILRFHETTQTQPTYKASISIQTEDPNSNTNFVGFPHRPPGLEQCHQKQVSKVLPQIPVHSKLEDLTLPSSSSYAIKSNTSILGNQSSLNRPLPVSSPNDPRSTAKLTMPPPQSDLGNTFIPFLNGSTKFKPNALLKDEALEKALTKLRTEWGEITPEHRAKLYEKLKKLGIPEKLKCRWCEKAMSNYFDYMNHCLSEKHRERLRQVNHYLIDQDYDVLQRAIRDSAPDEWLEPGSRQDSYVPMFMTNPDKNCLFKSDDLKRASLNELKEAYMKADEKFVNANPWCWKLKLDRCGLCSTSLVGLKPYDFAKHIFDEKHKKKLMESGFSVKDVSYWKIRFCWVPNRPTSTTPLSLQNHMKPPTAKPFAKKSSANNKNSASPPNVTEKTKLKN